MRSVRLFFVVVGVLGLAAATTLAHQGVTNPAVKARMDGMTAISEEVKILGQMAKGSTDFDANAARLAAAAIADHASEIPMLFEHNETDPVTEARPEIWTKFRGFYDKGKRAGGNCRWVVGIDR